jgi:hypothetical protein
MVTGWKCRTISFADYFEKWRVAYVDRPVYYEKLRYVKQFMAAKEQYVDRPINRYINFPIEKYGIHAVHAKKLYLERPLDELIQRIKDTPDEADIASMILGKNNDEDNENSKPDEDSENSKPDEDSENSKTDEDNKDKDDKDDKDDKTDKADKDDKAGTKRKIPKSIITVVTIIATIIVGLLFTMISRKYMTSLITDPKKHLILSYGIATIMGLLVIKYT